MFRTGDFGHIKRVNKVEAGILFYEGRKDSQIKIRGYRIDMAGIEARLAEEKELIAKAVVLHNKRRENESVRFNIIRTGLLCRYSR